MMNSTPGFENKKKFSNYFLLGAVIAVFAVFLVMIRVFIIPMIIAVVISIMMYPLYRSLLKLTRDKRSLSSLLCCLIVIIALLVPLAFIADQVVLQSIELYHGAGPLIDEATQKVKAGAIGGRMNAYVEQWFPGYDIAAALKPILLNFLKQMGAAAPTMINKFSRTTIDLIFGSFVVIFSLFYFLRDGERLILKVRGLVPIGISHKEKIITGVYSMSNAIIKGIFLIALIQSILGTLTLWIFGFKAWLLWGLVMLVLSVIPFVGTGAVLVPAGIITIMMGDVWQGILIIMISVLFISLIDNILRPRIIGYHAGMHDLLVFFSIIGGIFTFGPAGLVIGPLVAAVFLTMTEIYKIEFQAHIDASEKS